jgi:predicted transglutaminase-like protease
VAPNEGIWKTLANIIPLSIMGFIIGFAFGFPMTTLPLLLSSVKIKQNLTDIVLSLSSQLSMSILLAIMFATLAVGACIKHFVLRIILYRTGYIPWNYASFLNYASDRIFLRKVGGSYIFIHRMLQEHFARMNSV